jgi:hypothetical protein
VETVKEALLSPAAIETLVGTVAIGLLLASDIVIPFAGAGPVSMTAALPDRPPTRVPGTRLIQESVGAVIFVVTDMAAPP